MFRMITTIAVSMLLVGCANGEWRAETEREFGVGLDRANAAVRTLYPTQLEWARIGAAATMPGGESGSMVRIRRDELSHEGQVVVLVEEKGDAPVQRTRITLKAVSAEQTKVGVQSTRSKKTVLMPERDAALEDARMKEIAKVIDEAR